jgi:hypothetical protein
VNLPRVNKLSDYGNCAAAAGQYCHVKAYQIRSRTRREIVATTLDWHSSTQSSRSPRTGPCFDLIFPLYYFSRRVLLTVIQTISSPSICDSKHLTTRHLLKHRIPRAVSSRPRRYRLRTFPPQITLANLNKTHSDINFTSHTLFSTLAKSTLTRKHSEIQSTAPPNGSVHRSNQIFEAPGSKNHHANTIFW